MFRRVNHLESNWALLDFHNGYPASLLVSETGYGDGIYPVLISQSDGQVAAIQIPFMESPDE